jgi:hypothetical protein
MKKQIDWNQKPTPIPEMTDLGEGAKQWHIIYNGMRVLHREDGPAAIHFDGDQSWFLYGELHREDGPAMDWIAEDKQWYYRGEKIPAINLKEFQSYVRNKAFW